VISFGRNIVSLMTGSLPFADAFPALVDVLAALDAAEAALQAAMNHGKQEIIEQDAAMATLLDLLRQLAAFVQNKCQNSLALLNSTGFEAIKKGQPLGPLSPPLPARTTHGMVSGTTHSRIKRVNGAYTYNWQLALASAPTVMLQTVTTTKASVDFTALTPGEVYNIQGQAVGAAGASNWSNASSIRVL
jgi:hypothetical protein